MPKIPEVLYKCVLCRVSYVPVPTLCFHLKKIRVLNSNRTMSRVADELPA